MLEPEVISSSMRGAGHAAAPKITKQNTTEVQIQEMSMIAMRQNAAFRVPHLSQTFHLESAATPIPSNTRSNTWAFDYCLAITLVCRLAARLRRTSTPSPNWKQLVLN